MIRGHLSLAAILFGEVWQFPAQGNVIVKDLAASRTSPILQCFINGAGRNIFELDSDVHKLDARVLVNFGTSFPINDRRHFIPDVRTLIGGDIAGEFLVRFHLVSR